MKIEDLERRLTGTFTGVCGDRASRVAVVAGIAEVQGQKPLLVLEKADGSLGLTELEGGTFFATREACDAAIEAEHTKRQAAFTETGARIAAGFAEAFANRVGEVTPAGPAAETAAAANETALGELALDTLAGTAANGELGTDSVDPSTGEITEAAA